MSYLSARHSTVITPEVFGEICRYVATLHASTGPALGTQARIGDQFPNLSIADLAFVTNAVIKILNQIQPVE